MRILLRVVSAILIVAGIGLGIVMPLLSGLVDRHELGRWPVFDRASGFRPQEVRVIPSGQTMRLLLRGRLNGPPASAGEGSILTVTAEAGGRTVLDVAVPASKIRPRLVDPQSGRLEYEVEAGSIADVDAPAYLITVGPGEAQAERIDTLDLVVETTRPAFLRTRQHLGFVMLGVGFLGFTLSRRRQPTNPNSQPPRPRWGRG